ncbi:MAG TPA: hypothetical protein VHP11_05305, partial [Tepidisphaeraceae bacterium]|nr:hypothetical protein [Tepidisphaeraceae bacterium]
KGARPLPAVVPKPIQIDGQFADWQDVSPEFRDTVGDPMHRDYRGWGKNSHYVNHTGRNDIIAAKVSRDDQNIQFYVRTRESLTPSTDPNWMLLFIDSDGDASTGWLGYDYVIGRSRPADRRASLERYRGPGYRWESIGTVTYQASDKEMELSIPLSRLGLKSMPAALDFKWADGIQQTGDWSDFTVNGDAAPNDRFNYRARWR